MQGQWASEKPFEAFDTLTNHQSARTKNTAGEIVEEDFIGQPQLDSKDSEDMRAQQKQQFSRKPDINEL